MTAQSLFFLVNPRPPTSTLFPYTTLFRSHCELKTITFADLVVAAARREGATLLIRGLRDGTDLDYEMQIDRKSTRLNSSHVEISYAVFCLKKKKQRSIQENTRKRKRRNFT